MKKAFILPIFFSLNFSIINSSLGMEKASAVFEDVHAEDVKNIIKKVHDRYYDSYFCDSYNWTDVTYHLGVLEAFKATGDTSYYNESYEYAEGYSWESNNGVLDTYLDNVTSSMVYCVLHSLAPADYKLEPSIELSEYLCSRGMFDSSWIDEIYMIGLTESYLSKVTGNPLYSLVDFRTYQFYRDMFFDGAEGLWYRDAKYIWGTGNPNSISTNGKKVFWGRGNTWIYVSLAQRLEYMDKNDPAYPMYLNDFLVMSNALKKCVREDGVWGANLGDVNDYPGKEMTGTGGFLSGLCYGIELGLLDYDEYYPVVRKAYETITTECIYENGLLGYCQPIGEGPKGYGEEIARKTTTNSFGVGLMLMGLSHFMRLCDDYEVPELNVETKDFDPSKAKYTIEDGYYKGVIVASSDARCETNNGPENLVNGVWARDNEYSRFSAYGLNSGPVVVNLDFTKQIEIGAFYVEPYNNRAYKLTIEAKVNGEYVTVVDTRAKKSRDSYLFKYFLDDYVTTDSIRLTGYGYHNGSTDMFSIREFLIYEGGAL